MYVLIQVVRNDFIPINSNEQHKKGSVQRRPMKMDVPPKIRCDCVEYVLTVLMKEEKKKNKQAHSFYGALKSAGFTS